MRDARNFARNDPFEAYATGIIAFVIIWGGAFFVALAG